MAEINLVVDEINAPIELKSISSDQPIQMVAPDVVEVLTSDYQKLMNKPSINGTELYDNYDEIDPTVPRWAKGEEPEEMNIVDIYDLWNSVFG